MINPLPEEGKGTTEISPNPQTPVNWLSKLPCTLKDPAEGAELVDSSTPRKKIVLFLLNPRFDYPADPPLQYP